MILYRERFSTQAEADAFVAGIRFADSDYIDCHEPEPNHDGSEWWVLIHNTRQKLFCDDICPLCVREKKAEAEEDAAEARR